MMFDYLGWTEVSQMIIRALGKTISTKIVTYDLARQIEGSTQVVCSEFAQEIIQNIQNK